MSDELRYQRLAEFERAWRDADLNYQDDIAAAAGDKALIRMVDRNWYAHQMNWADAAVAMLEIQSDAVAAAHEAAKAANGEVTAARERAARLPEIIRTSATAANALLKELDEIAKA